MLTPHTMITRAPVRAEFSANNVEILGRSYENMSVLLETRTPKEILTRLLDLSPEIAWHLINVSANHFVEAATVLPVVLAGEISPLPKLVPISNRCGVMGKSEPSVGKFSTPNLYVDRLCSNGLTNVKCIIAGTYTCKYDECVYVSVSNCVSIFGKQNNDDTQARKHTHLHTFTRTVRS